MTISCPNCHHPIADVSSSLDEFVKPEQEHVANPMIDQVEEIPAKDYFRTDVNDWSDVEPSVAQGTRGAKLTAANKAMIRNMFLQGSSAARIRQELGLKVPIAAIYAVVEKKRS